MQKQNSKLEKLWVIFLCGIIIGCIGINLFIQNDIEIVEKLNIYVDQFEHKIKEKEILYILNKRLKQLFVIFILYITISKKMIIRIITFIFALLLGTYLSVMMMRLGIYGGIYTLMLYFPHFLFYALAIKLLYIYADLKKRKQKGLLCTMVVICWLLGIVLEQYIFPQWFVYINI